MNRDTELGGRPMTDAPTLIRLGARLFRPEASWFYRVGGPVQWLADRGLVGSVLDFTDADADEDLLGLVDALCLFFPPPGDGRLVRFFQRVGNVCFAGLDDNLWTFTPWHPGRRIFSAEFMDRASRDLGGVLASLIGGVLVTTPALADVVSQWTAAPVSVIPNAVLPIDRMPRSAPHGGRKVRLGWAGTPSHEGDWDAIRAAVEGVLRERRDVEMVLFTKHPPAWLQTLRRRLRVAVHPPVPFCEYYATLAGLGLDLFIAPLTSHPFNESKSPIKAVEAMAVGLPVIASDVGPYRLLPSPYPTTEPPPIVRLPNVTEAWVAAMTALLDDPDRRRRLGEAGRAWVGAHATLDSTGPRWAEALGLGSGRPEAIA